MKPKASFFAEIICDETNIKNFAIECGKSENGLIRLNYNQESKEWYWLIGDERKEIKDMSIVDKIYENHKT